MTIAYDTKSAEARIFDPVFNVMHNLQRKHAERRAFRATRRELMALSDDNLEDLGLTRSGIDRAAIESTIGFARS